MEMSEQVWKGRKENPGQGQLRWSLKINVARSQSQRAPGMTGIPLELPAKIESRKAVGCGQVKLCDPFEFHPADRRTCRRVCASYLILLDPTCSWCLLCQQLLNLTLLVDFHDSPHGPYPTTSHPSHWQQANGPHAVGALHQGITRLICLQTSPRVLHWVLGFEIWRRQGPHFRAHQHTD